MFLTSFAQPVDLSLGPQAWVLGLGILQESWSYDNSTNHYVVRCDATPTLLINASYDWTLTATETPGVTNINHLHFDTFSTNDDSVIEAEDYNFGGGEFIDNPVLTAEGSPPEADSYRGQAGVPGVDFLYQTHASSGVYPAGVGLKRSLDYLRPQFLQAGGPTAGFEDYDVFGLNAGDYLNYSRFFPRGSNYYTAFLRESIVNMQQSTVALELVTSDPSTTNQTTQPLGYFV